jgi:hypothetical protein
MKKLVLILIVVAGAATIASAQNDRISDFNNTNWVQIFVTKAISKKTDFLIEYQWRRTPVLKNWQQGLFRTAIQYRPNANVSVAGGYAQAETFVYGDYPIAANGTFPENRTFEQLVFKQTVNKLAITNRFRVEQRWVGKVKAGTNREIEDWIFSNRFRYQCRLQLPLHTKNDQQLYTALADEIFIGAGKNVGANIFDQNRVFALFGYKFSKHISVELGFFNVTLQQGRRVNNKAIFQRNNGAVLSTSFSL